MYTRTGCGGYAEVERVSEIVEMDLVTEAAKKTDRSLRTIVVAYGTTKGGRDYILRRPRAALV